MLYQLVYSSQIEANMGETGAKDITFSASDASPPSSVSGIALFDGSLILQVLEGEENDVRALYNKIMRDTRHSSVVVIAEQPAKSRAFDHNEISFKRVKSEDGKNVLITLSRNARNLSHITQNVA